MNRFPRQRRVFEEEADPLKTGLNHRDHEKFPGLWGALALVLPGKRSAHACFETESQSLRRPRCMYLQL